MCNWRKRGGPRGSTYVHISRTPGQSVWFSDQMLFLFHEKGQVLINENGFHFI